MLLGESFLTKNVFFCCCCCCKSHWTNQQNCKVINVIFFYYENKIFFFCLDFKFLAQIKIPKFFRLNNYFFYKSLLIIFNFSFFLMISIMMIDLTSKVIKQLNTIRIYKCTIKIIKINLYDYYQRLV